MIGSVIGDVVGSIYEFRNIKTKEFPFFDKRMEYTDDSVLTFATAQWLLDGGEPANYYYRFGSENECPMGGYGGRFQSWLIRSARGIAAPYGSCGNGSAMRVGPVGWAFDTAEQTLAAAERSAACTHNHPEGIKGAQATALAIFMARKGVGKDEIRRAMEEQFGYDLSLTVDEIRPRYSWDGLDGNLEASGATCQGSVPQALVCALEAVDFEDAIRNAISIGGDSDTVGCIAGSVAEALYGVPGWMRDHVMTLLSADFKRIIAEFEQLYGAGWADGENARQGGFVQQIRRFFGFTPKNS
ncbi:MAG: ADP-ribosylglycohydrolase family protein [Muribaculaceae bacterium]|nr:ADP-ribosylglycohydrolase family protein [Muribaculaceae bacterium]